MPADDWTRQIYTKDSPYSIEEMAENLSNARQFVDPNCTLTVQQGFDILALEKYVCYRYMREGNSIYVSFLDKTESNMQMWRLAFLSFNTVNVPSSEVSGVIIRAIKENLTAQYLNKITCSKGLYYYTSKAGLARGIVLDKVLTEILGLMKLSSYSNFLELAQEDRDNNILWTLKFKANNDE